MPIWLEVNPRSRVPLYVQLVEQIKRAVQVGILRPGESLPPVRQLASELHIALNTIVKAYAELEALGMIETHGGAGTVIRTPELQRATERWDARSDATRAGSWAGGTRRQERARAYPR